MFTNVHPCNVVAGGTLISIVILFALAQSQHCKISPTPLIPHTLTPSATLSDTTISRAELLHSGVTARPHDRKDSTMSTAAQLTANHTNALLSTGPRTDATKAISSRNNLRHGFRSQTVLLPGDDPSEYDGLLAELSAHFVTRDLTELRFVREMADAEWRLRRVRQCIEDALTRRIEALTPQYTEAHPEPDSITLQSMAIETLKQATGTSYETWLRYETKFERQYDRAHRDWIRYQTDVRRVEAKEADIWMKKVLFAPTSDSSRDAALTEGLHSAAQLRELASSVQNAPAALPSAQAATHLASSVQNAAAAVPSAQAATRAAVVRGSNKASSVPNPALPPQTPRNAPCPCGSRDKFKRCCGKNAPPVLNTLIAEAA